MPQKGTLLRNITVLIIIAAILIPAAVILFQDNTNLTGSAITQEIDNGDEPDAPAEEADDSGGSSESDDSSDDESEADEPDESSEESDESNDTEAGGSEDDGKDQSSSQPQPAQPTSQPQPRTQGDSETTSPSDGSDPDAEAEEADDSDAGTDGADESGGGEEETDPSDGGESDEESTGAGETDNETDVTDTPSGDGGSDAGDETSPTSTPSDEDDAADDEQPESTEAVDDSDTGEEDDSGAPEATDEPSATATPGPEITDEPDTVPVPQPEMTEEAAITPTPGPEITEEPDAEITPEVEVTEPVIDPEATVELTPEVTAEVDLEATVEVTAEVTPELTPELTPEVTPELTPEVVQLEVAQSCTASGVEFTISSSGDMTAAETYSIDGETAGEFQLSAGESLSISAGFGQPVFSTAGIAIQPEEPCEQPPVIEITSAVCVPETGFVIALTNSGGPMTEASPYTVDGEPAGEFMLGTDETTEIELGFGSPVFVSDELTATPETACEPTGSVSGSIWMDFNGDGLFGEDESGLADLTLILSSADGSTLLETVSTEDGSYLFEQLLAGEYTLQIANPPAGTLPTVDPDGGQDSSALVTIGIEPTVADFAYEPLGSISGVVWSDLNADGIQTDDEPGLPGISLTLTDSEENALTIESDETGAYAFADLRTGDYSLSLDTPPDRSILVQPDSESLSIALAPDEDASASFAYQPLGTISGVVWADLNSDGAQGESEPGLPGISLTLIDSGGAPVTIASGDAGTYTFEDIRAGDYTVRVEASSVPEGYTLAGADPSAEAITSLTLAAGSEANASFGYLPRLLGSVSGVVWADLDGDGSRAETEPGLGGIAVMLSLPDGDIQTSTAADGTYRFDNLEPGDYVARITAETLGDSLAVTGEADDVPDGNMQLTVEESPLESINFGLQPASLGSISGMIWLETGDFGVRNEGETGLAGATVQLVDSTGAILQTITVRADGKYTFTDLLPGTYTVILDPASLPDPIFVTVDPDDSGDFNTTITLSAGGVVDDVEFGLVGTF
ncbi:MAG: hypothetical protein CL610_30475 [Anaerolineaceae bacterium]|nr:hypothetical protein [Anaerolineaceae bacterium]